MDSQVFKGKIKTIGSGISTLGNASSTSGTELSYIELNNGTIIKQILVPGMMLNDKLNEASHSGSEIELHIVWPNKKRKTGFLLALIVSNSSIFVPDLSPLKQLILVKRIYAVGFGLFGIPMLFAGGLGLLCFWLAWYSWREGTYFKNCIAYSNGIPNAIVC